MVRPLRAVADRLLACLTARVRPPMSLSLARAGGCGQVDRTMSAIVGIVSYMHPTGDRVPCGRLNTSLWAPVHSHPRTACKMALPGPGQGPQLGPADPNSETWTGNLEIYPAYGYGSPGEASRAPRGRRELTAYPANLLC